MDPNIFGDNLFKIWPIFQQKDFDDLSKTEQAISSKGSIYDLFQKHSLKVLMQERFINSTQI